MNDLKIIVIYSSFEHLEKLNDRIYFEIERDGYHNLITETKEGIRQSLTIFRNLKNIDHLTTLIHGYEYLNDADTYIGKVLKIEKYIAKEYSGSPIRLKVYADNRRCYDIPEDAEEHLGIKLP